MKVSICALALAAAFAVTASASARPGNIEGKWRLNPKETETLPGEEAPAELIMAITKDDGRAFEWTVSVKFIDGSGGSVSFSGAIDGKPYPVNGRPGSTSKFSWTPDGALKQVSEGPSGFSVETCGFTPDMKKMECEARQTDLKGRVYSYIETFDRL